MMSIGNIIKIKQPNVYKQLIKMASKNKPKIYNDNINDLTFEDFEKMMRHDSYKKIRGSTRQVKHG